MNKYAIPICNLNTNRTYIKVIIAKSISDCQNKLIADLNLDDDAANYREFIRIADSKYDILIGDIKDVEEL